MGEHKTQFEYVDKSGLVKTEKLPNGSKFSYGYDLADNLTAITQSTEDGEENSVSRVYEDGLLKKLVSGNTKIEYNYNFINRKVDTIWLNGAIEKGYTYSNGDKTVQVFDRDLKTISSTTKDDFGNIVEVKKGDTVIESNVYEKGLIKTSTKNAIRSTYNYDENVPERLASITYSNAVSKTFTYDEWGNVTTQNYKENNKDNITTYTYSNDSKKKLTSVNLNNEYIISPQTDIHSRNVGKKFETANGVKIDEESITYAKFGDHATSLPSSIKYWNKTTQSFNDKLDYKYDSMGNIISITQNGKLLSKYTYDKLNRLVREDNTAFGKTYLFEYDNTGNITSKRTCPFTLEKKENISVFEEENTFSYIGDVLYGKDDVTCINEHGRPTVYLGNAVTYKEDGLISSYKGINFLYDTCGNRQLKGSMTFSYNNDGLLTRQSNGISFIYDHTSSPIGIKNGTTPYF
ncbi:MAG: RHS repeat protein, partial [Clostridia bacterium]|nr:RHS repeat protein [Clostridia bacterium]